MQAKERKFTIGRSRDCDIVLSDDSVSRRHAELIFMPAGKLLLIDCRSQNGTALIKNGKSIPIHQEFLLSTDDVMFGDVKMTVKALLEGIHLKFQSFDMNSSSNPPHKAQNQSRKLWVRGDRLVRCRCGAIKPKGEKCEECGQ